MLDILIGPVTLGELILITTVTLMCIAFFIRCAVDYKVKKELDRLYFDFPKYD